MNRLTTSLLASIFWTSVQLSGSPLEIETAKGVSKNFSLKQMLELTEPITLRVKEHHEKKILKFRAFSLNKVLDKWRPDWRQSEEILLTCADGYQPSVPVKNLLENEAYLAFEIVGRKTFQVQPADGKKKKILLGPYYLVWDNLKNKDLQESFHIWPYQVVKLEFIRFRDKFPQISPPAKASPAVLSGFLLFREKCMSCHAINGAGGVVGPELNYPHSVTEYFQPAWLRRWILEPDLVRVPNKMPRLFQGSQEDQRKVDDIIAYLKAMKWKKMIPKNKK